MNFMDRTEILDEQTAGTDTKGVYHWQRMQITEWWEAIDTAGKVCTTDKTREAVIASHNRSYEFLMQQTAKYGIDWDSDEHGKQGPPLPLGGVRKVVRREMTSSWEEKSQIEEVST